MRSAVVWGDQTSRPNVILGIKYVSMMFSLVVKVKIPD